MLPLLELLLRLARLRHRMSRLHRARQLQPVQLLRRVRPRLPHSQRSRRARRHKALASPQGQLLLLRPVPLQGMSARLVRVARRLLARPGTECSLAPKRAPRLGSRALTPGLGPPQAKTWSSVAGTRALGTARSSFAL